MRLKNFKIWGIFIAAMIVIAFMLFQQSSNNKKELEEQAIRNINLIAQNVKVYYEAHIANKLQERRKDSICRGNCENLNITEEYRRGVFEKVKVNKVTLKNGKNNLPFLEIELDSNHLDSIFFGQLFSKIDKQQFFGKVLISLASGQILYPQSDNGKSVGDFDKRSQEVVHLPINKETIKHDNQDYLHYYTLVEIGNNRFYVSGLIKNSYFDAIGKQVNFAHLTFLVFLLAIMLFSLPILSFLGLSKGDKVTRFGVYSIGLSLVGIMVLLGFGFSFFQNHHPVSHESHDETMEEIKRDVEANIQGKLTILDSWSTDSIEKYNELVSINPNGGIDSLYISGEKETENSFRSLKHRQYYRHFLKDQTESEFDQEKNGEYYIGSHYSLDNSQLESVISTLYTDNKVKIVTFNWEKGLTKFDDTRGFLIFKEDGLILHKSPKVKIIADSLSQLLSSIKWREVESIIDSNKGAQDSVKVPSPEWEIPLYLDGHAFITTLIPIDAGRFDETLWMIYLQDEHVEHVFSSLVTFESLIFLIFYLLVLALISLANRLNKSSSTISPIKKFAYDYLFPKPSLERNFVILIWFLATYVFIILYFHHLKDIDFFGMFLVLVISTFHLKVLMYIWLRSIPTKQGTDPKEYLQKIRKAKSSLHIFILLMTVALIVPFVLLFPFVQSLQYFIFLAWVVLSAGLSYKSRLQILKVNPAVKKGNLANFQSLYFSFLLMWLFMVGFIPGFVIHSKVHRFEIGNWQLSSDQDFKSDPDDFWIAYDESRRIFFNALTNLDDPQIREFVFPNREKFQPDHSKASSDTKFIKTISSKISWFSWNLLRVSMFLIISIAFFWWLIKKLAHQIYLLDYSFFLNRNHSTPLSNKLFLCGNDSEMYLPWIKENYSVQDSDILITDCLTNPSLTWANNSLPDLTNKSTWMINNVHCLPDHTILANKLPKFIEAATGKVRLVLCSGQSWKELFKFNQSNNAQIIYSQIFCDFHFEYVPISLPKGLDIVLKSEEESSVMIRSMKAYFVNIWEELSFEERKVCYYFSSEGFFNYTNSPVITELIQKGVLVRPNRDELPKLFHRVFRQFILANVSDEEKEAFKNDERRNGNAGSIQIAIFSFILLSLALISYFDKSFLDQASTFVAAIAGTLGGLYSIFSKALSGLGSKNSG